ncbi:MAG: tetratricopeptide repeat protein [Isosphaeraceae bacterium]
MKSLRIVFQFGLLIGLGIAIPGLPTTAQSTSPNKAQPPAPGLQKLTSDDARRAEELDKAIAAALKADRWDEAIATSQELLGLRTRVQGPKHFETVNAEWRLKALHRVAPMPHEDRVAYQSANTMNEQAVTLNAQGKYAAAQPLYEKALEIRRRRLTDDHPDTALSYNNLAYNLNAQGKYPESRDRWLNAVKSLDKARLRVAFTGLERAGGTKESMRPAPAAVLTRLGEPAQAWQNAGGRPGPRPARRAGRPPGPSARIRRASPPPRLGRRTGTARPAGGNHAQGPRPGRAGQAIRRPEAPARAGQHRPG